MHSNLPSFSAHRHSWALVVFAPSSEHLSARSVSKEANGQVPKSQAEVKTLDRIFYIIVMRRSRWSVVISL